MRYGTFEIRHHLRYLFAPSCRWLCTCLLATAPAISNAQLLQISAADEPAEIAQVSLEQPQSEQSQSEQSQSVEPVPIVEELPELNHRWWTNDATLPFADNAEYVNTSVSQLMELALQHSADIRVISNRTVPRSQELDALTRLPQPILWRRAARFNEAIATIARQTGNPAREVYLVEIQAHLMKIADAYWSHYGARSALAQDIRLFLDTEELLEHLEAKKGDADLVATQRLSLDAALEQRKANLVRSRGNIVDAETHLRSLVNAPELGEVSGPIEMIPKQLPRLEPVAIDLENIMKTASAHRAEITKCLRDIRDAAHELQVSRGYGNLDVIALRQKQLNQMESRYQATLEHIGSELQLVVNEIATAYEEVVAKHRSLDAAYAETNSLKAAWKRSLEISGSNRLEFEALLRSQRRAIQRERELLAAEVSYNIGITRLKQANGTLLAWHNRQITQQLESMAATAASNDQQTTETVDETEAATKAATEEAVVEGKVAAEAAEPETTYTPPAESLEVIPPPARPPELPSGQERVQPMRRLVPRVNPPVVDADSKAPRVARKEVLVSSESKLEPIPDARIQGQSQQPNYPWSVPAPPAARPMGFYLVVPMH